MGGVIFAKSKRQATVEQAKAVVDVVRKFGERKACISAPSLESTRDFSERCLSFRRASKRTPLVCGVFVDATIDEIAEACAGAGIDVVQLHGKEDNDFVNALRQRVLGVWIVKVVHIPAANSDGANGAPANGAADANEKLKAILESYSHVCDAM